MAEYDLTSKIAPYLDRHLVFGLMEFIAANTVTKISPFDAKTLLKVKIDLLDKTKMVDFSVDVYQQLNPDSTEVPMELVDRRAEVLKQLVRIDEEIEPLVNILSSEENTAVIEKTRDVKQLLGYLSEKGFKMEMLGKLYKSAKFLYDCGNYQAASQYLYFVRVLLPPTDPNFMNAMWGKLASDILLQEWENSMDGVNKLQEVIDNNISAPLVLLQQRTWLIHWSLFVFHNHPKGNDLIINTFLYSPNYLNTIQTTCPHILRYLTAAVVTSRSRRAEQHHQVLKDLVRVIQQESYTYSDPTTDFISCLYHHFDFDGAQKKLVECKTLILNDFFLVGCYDSFIENARLLIFETFCKIRNRISIKMLAVKLDMEAEAEAERWIVDLIRNARLDAKVDSKQGLVIMGTQPVSAYQQVVEKTKNLAFKTQKLVMDIRKNFGEKEVEVNQWNE